MVSTQQEIDAVACRAREHYVNHIVPQLTDDDINRFIAIDTVSGEWEISDGEEAADQLRARLPKAVIYLLVHPRIWVDSFGGSTGIEPTSRRAPRR